MELIIAIVFGTFLIIKIVSKRKKDQEHDEQLQIQRDQAKSRRDRWEVLVTDRALEAKLEEEIHRELIKEDFQKKVIAVLEDAPAAYAEKIRYNKDMLLRLFMAEHGKLRFQDAALGIHVFAYGPTEVQRQENGNIQRWVVFHIQEKLKQHGVNETLYFQTGHAKIGEGVQYASFSDKENGDYIWGPAL